MVNFNRPEILGREKTAKSCRARLHLAELLFFFFYVSYSLLTPKYFLKVHWVKLLVNLEIPGSFLSFYTAHMFLNIPLPQAVAQVLGASNTSSPHLAGAGRLAELRHAGTTAVMGFLPLAPKDGISFPLSPPRSMGLGAFLAAGPSLPGSVARSRLRGKSRGWSTVLSAGCEIAGEIGTSLGAQRRGAGGERSCRPGSRRRMRWRSQNPDGQAASSSSNPAVRR